MAQTARPSESEVLGSLRAELSSDARVHGLAYTGESEHLWFYLVVWTAPHRDGDDLQQLKLRYFQYPKPSAPGGMEPTLKTNGIHIREETDPDAPNVREALVRLCARAKHDASSDTDTDGSRPLVL